MWAGIGAKAIADYTAEDVVMALTTTGVRYTLYTLVCCSFVFQIDFDLALALKEAIDGPALRKLRTEGAVQKRLGLKHIADATRVLNMVKSVVNGTGIPPALDITAAGRDDQPATWSVEQLFQHVSAGPLAEVAALLKQHKFAGDVIATMDLSAIAVALDIDALEDAFFEVMEALRARTGNGL